MHGYGGHVATVTSVKVVEWVLAAAGVLTAAAFASVVARAVHASVRTTAAVRRDTTLLDGLFDGTASHVTYRTGSGPAGGPTATVLIAGAMDRGYRFVEASRHGGRTTMEFHRSHRESNDT